MIENTHAQGDTEPYAPGMPQAGDMPSLPDVALPGVVGRDIGAQSEAPSLSIRVNQTHHNEARSHESPPRHDEDAIPDAHQALRGAQSTPVILDALASLAELGSAAHTTDDPEASLARALDLARSLLPATTVLAVYGRGLDFSRSPDDANALVLLASTALRHAPAHTNSAPDRNTPAVEDQQMLEALPGRLAPNHVSRLMTGRSSLEDEGPWYVGIPGEGVLAGALAVLAGTRAGAVAAWDASERAAIRVLCVSLGTILSRRERTFHARQLTAALRTTTDALTDGQPADEGALDEGERVALIAREAAGILTSLAPDATACALLLEPGTLEAREISLDAASDQAARLSSEATRDVIEALGTDRVGVVTDEPGKDTRWDALAPVRALLADRLGQRAQALLVLGIRRGTQPIAVIILGQPNSVVDPFLPSVAALVGSRAEARFAELALAAAGEEQARTFDQFLSLAAHELRSPLTSVKGYGQLLLRQAGKLGLPERVVRSSEAIVQQSERLAEMIDELHDAARIRRGRIELAHDPVDLVAVTERIIPRLQHEYPRRQVEVESTVESAIGDWDAPRVAQCVRALIDNALRFSPDAGTVKVQIRARATENAADGPGEATLCVRDAGIGIPTDERDSICDFLYRGPSAEQRNLAGLGLGLFVAQNIARMLGGRLWLAWSASGEDGDELTGAEFCLALPLTDAPEATAE